MTGEFMTYRKVGFALLACMGATGQSVVAQEKLPKLNPEGWTSAAVCGECHQSIYAVWSHSVHSKAWTNGVFQAGYRRAVEAYGADGARLCFDCHAPTTKHTKDYSATDPITAEGVTCDYCHSVSAVDLSGDDVSVSYEVGKIKYGPLKHAQSPVHEVRDSPLHRSSEFCAGCHEYRNQHGVLVLGTYSEWKSGPSAKRGQQCQDCHMPLVPGRVVALNIKADTPSEVNLHDISGSHDLDQVRKAITLKLEGTDWIGDRVWVFLEVANTGSGHCFPTGMPMHRAVLEVVLRDRGHEIDRREIPFEVVMLDEQGRPLRREHEVLVKAVRIRSDTRLRPGETRPLEISFRNVKGSKITVSAKLTYMYSTETVVIEDGQERIEPVEMSFLVASAQKTVRKPGR